MISARPDHFRLSEEHYLVEGESGAAVYDLLSGQVYSIDSRFKDLLRMCEQNQSIVAVAKKLELSVESALTFLIFLKQQGLGSFLKTPRHIEKLRKGHGMKIAPYYRSPPDLTTVFLEVGSDCNFDCHFCQPGQTIIRRRACMGCQRSMTDKSQSLDLTETHNILVQIGELGTKELILTGGNPLLMEPEKFQSILKSIHTAGIGSASVITNGCVEDNAMLDLLIEYQVSPIIQVFSYKREDYDTMTGCVNSYQRILSGIEYLQKQSLPFIIMIFALEYDIKLLEETVKFFQSLSPSQIMIDYQHITNQKEEEKAVSKGFPHYLINQGEIPQTSLQLFADRQKFNPCLAGKLAISSSGEVFPCPAMRTNVIGSLRDDLLSNLFSTGRIDDYWELPKEQLSGCESCEYRYACNDCRAAELAYSGKLKETTLCAYDPKHGKWKVTT